MLFHRIFCRRIDTPDGPLTSRVRGPGVMGADAMAWLSGFESVMRPSMDHPDLAAEDALVHGAGRLLGCIITSAFRPIVDDIIGAWKRYRA